MSWLQNSPGPQLPGAGEGEAGTGTKRDRDHSALTLELTEINQPGPRQTINNDSKNNVMTGAEPPPTY